MVSTEYRENYYKTLSLLFNSIKVTDKEGNEIEFFHGTENVCSLIRLKADSGCKSMFIGNGASAAISRECNVITLSGLKDDNLLNVMGDLKPDHKTIAEFRRKNKKPLQKLSGNVPVYV